MIAPTVAIDRTRRILHEASELPVVVRSTEDLALTGEVRPGWQINVGSSHFIAAFKHDNRTASVSRAVEQLLSYQKLLPKAGLLLVVNHMTDVGADICRRARVNWLDLDGNAFIRDRNLLIRIRGERKALSNQSQHENRVNPFSTKASRIVAVLLSAPRHHWSRSEIAAMSGLDKGYVSKTINELRSQGHVEEMVDSKRRRVLTVHAPIVLLDAWAEHYRPPAVSASGLVAARDGFETARITAASLDSDGSTYALTALPAAAEYASFGSFRRVDVYVDRPPSDDVAAALGIGGDARGHNVRIMVDKFCSKFAVEKRGKLYLASAARVYLDLLHAPERAAEAREQMRAYMERLWA